MRVDYSECDPPLGPVRLKKLEEFGSSPHLGKHGADKHRQGCGVVFAIVASSVSYCVRVARRAQADPNRREKAFTREIQQEGGA